MHLLRVTRQWFQDLVNHTHMFKLRDLAQEYVALMDKIASIMTHRCYDFTTLRRIDACPGVLCQVRSDYIGRLLTIDS